MYATIAWLENGVSVRVVYTSDINTSKSGKTKFSEIVNNISIRRSMGRKNTLITGQTLEKQNELVYFFLLVFMSLVETSLNCAQCFTV